tara:strand:- start:544 stop:807 length:264 start_codon:yes stop_codon:yes gene_type:complete
MAQKGKKKSGAKAIKSMEKILKTPKKAETVVKAAAKYVNKTHWDTKEAFAAAIDKSGLSSDQVNVENEWSLYQSDKEGYRNTLKLTN